MAISIASACRRFRGEPLVVALSDSPRKLGMRMSLLLPSGHSLNRRHLTVRGDASSAEPQSLQQCDCHGTRHPATGNLEAGSWGQTQLSWLRYFAYCRSQAQQLKSSTDPPLFSAKAKFALRAKCVLVSRSCQCRSGTVALAFCRMIFTPMASKSAARSLRRVVHARFGSDILSQGEIETVRAAEISGVSFRPGVRHQ